MSSSSTLGRLCEGWLWMKAPAGSSLLRSPKYKSRWLVLQAGSSSSEAVVKCYNRPEDADVAGRELGMMPVSSMQVQPNISLQGALFKNFSFFAILPATAQERAGYKGWVELGATTQADRVRWVDALLEHGAVSQPSLPPQKQIALFKDPHTPKGSVFAITLGLFDVQDDTSIQGGNSQEALARASLLSGLQEGPDTPTRPDQVDPIDIPSTVFVAVPPDSADRSAPPRSTSMVARGYLQEEDDEARGRRGRPSLLERPPSGSASALPGDGAVQPRRSPEPRSPRPATFTGLTLDAEPQTVSKSITFTALTLEAEPRIDSSPPPAPIRSATFSGLMLGRGT